MGKIASSKQTGLGGVSYEDKVNAYFMACMLSETPPFNKNYGLIERIDFQTRADGWLFDDTLLTMQSNGVEKRIAVSSKSGNQFTTNGCPQDINRLLWEQFLHVGDASSFKADTDYVCKIEPPLSRQVSADLNTILTQAYEQDSPTLQRRNAIDGSNSKAIRKIYKSFYCPEELATTFGITNENTGNLLKCFIHYEMDFESVNSSSEQATIRLCQSILKNKQFDSAVSLYKVLAALPRELAPVSGYLNKEKLVQKLRGQFELEDFPLYQLDWKKLDEHTSAKLSLIQETIGGKILLKRSDYSEASKRLIAKTRCLFIIGISGGGKTVVAKRLAENLKNSGRVIWVDSGDFELMNLEPLLGLHNTLPVLINNSTTALSCLFIDALEKLYEENQQKRLALVIKAILDNPNNGWKIVITTTSDSFNSLLTVLNSHNINFSSFEQLPVSDINDEDVGLICTEFPSLLPLLYNNKIRPILSNLKLLDKLARLPSQTAYQDKEFIGETEFIDYLWQSEIESSENGFQKALFLKRLAEKQADALALSTSLSEFSISETEPLSALVKSTLVSSVNERLFFNHDLYGDWARYRILISQTENLQQFLKGKHLASPLWARALRLYGIRKLEQEIDVSNWEKLIEENNDQSSVSILIQNTFFESLFFSNNAGDYLEKHKQFLFKNKGEYFQRLVRLFLIKATVANPEIIKLAQEAGISSHHALDIDRIPLYSYWGDMLIFLHRNIDTMLTFGWHNISSLPNIWLKKTPPGYPLRTEAVEINLKIVNEIISNRAYIDEKLKKPVFESLLLGYRENPEATKKLCLQLCRRLEINRSEEAVENNTITKTAPRIMDMLPYTKMDASQWPDGPYERVDGAFQSVCLETNYLTVIIQNDAPLATEVLLAVLIDEPKERYLGASSYRGEYCLHEPIQWYPPFYLRGPFLNFFRLCPEEAIKFAVKLTDFATERWLEEDKEEAGIEQSVVVPYNEASKKYSGNQVVFGWHKDFGNIPHSLVSMLMAFEQFLYEEIEKERPVGKYVEIAIASTNSLAIAGLLLVVAKIAPELYTKELKHLLPVSIFYKWDLHSQYHDSFSMWYDIPKSWIKQAEEWKNRKHRFFPLKDAVLNYFLFNEELQKIFEPIRESWKEELAKAEVEGYEDVYLLQMIPQFDIKNFQFVKQDDKYEIIYNEPDEVKNKLEQGRKQSLETLDVGHFAFQCLQLIEKNTDISLEQAEQIWARISHWLDGLPDTMDDKDHDLDLWASPYTNIFAGMAVLVQCKDTWINSHSEYYDKIKNFSLSVIDEQIEKKRDFPPHGTFNDWNHFLAMLAPVLWKDDTGNRDFRKLVAAVCILFNNSTTEKLFKETAKHFPWHSVPFIQLQNLLALHSVEQYKFYEARSDNKSALFRARTDLIENFSDNKIADEITPLAMIRTEEKWLSKETRHWRRTEDEEDYVRKPSLDTELLREMLVCLPDLNDIHDPVERGHVIALWDESFKQVIYELGEIKETSKVIDKFPDKFHLLVAQKIGGLLPLLNEAENLGRFWKPLFEFGYIAPKLIEQFCTYFYLRNIEKKERHERMVGLIREMLVFTSVASTWSTKHINRHEDFRLCIMGMQHSLLSIWGDDLTPFTTLAQEDYKKWFLKNRLNHHVVESLLDFCTKKSGAFIYKEALMVFRFFFGLGELLEQRPTPKGYVQVGHPEHDYKLAIALSDIWEKQKNQLKRDDILLKIFKDLVQYSVSKNNPVAIELQMKLIVE